MIDTYSGDLRKLADEADENVGRASGLFQPIPGIGPAGADIVLREVQAVWPWVRPFFDDRARDGAKLLELPVTKLDTLVEPDDYARFALALVRLTLDDDNAKEIVTDIRG